MLRIGVGPSLFSLLLGILGVATIGAAAPVDPDLVEGRELFTREWLPEDQRSPDGDGLGPVFNDTSCVGCHNQGGVGGAGPGNKDVLLASVFLNKVEVAVKSGKDNMVLSFGPDGNNPPLRKSKARAAERRSKGEAKSKEEMSVFDRALQRNAVAEIHPAFRFSNTIVVHHSSTSPDYAKAQATLLGRSDPAVFRSHPARSQVGDYTLLFSRRNTPALFGSGIIEAIPDDVLLKAEARKYPAYPQVSGRVARLPEGKLGRFGWKAQKGSLEGFVLTACAVELGLEVPGEHQAPSPHDPDYKSPGLDLTAAQCDDLASFVASLPAPRQQESGSKEGNAFLAKGRRLFEGSGCAACHTPDLEGAEGIYSDLLLHDMGVQNSDIGAYGALIPNSSDDATEPVPPLVQIQTVKPEAAGKKRDAEEKLTTATRLEWRTPPLWGVRDSGPYLHDGRAATLEHAISLHGGEAERSKEQFLKLTKDDQQQLNFFLRSLVAP